MGKIDDEKLKEKLIEYFGEDAIPDYQWDSLIADIEELINWKGD